MPRIIASTELTTEKNPFTAHAQATYSLSGEQEYTDPETPARGGTARMTTPYRNVAGRAPFLFPGHFKTDAKFREEGGLHE